MRLDPEAWGLGICGEGLLSSRTWLLCHGSGSRVQILLTTAPQPSGVDSPEGSAIQMAKQGSSPSATGYKLPRGLGGISESHLGPLCAGRSHLPKGLPTGTACSPLARPGLYRPGLLGWGERVEGRGSRGELAGGPSCCVTCDRYWGRGQEAAGQASFGHSLACAFIPMFLPW